MDDASISDHVDVVQFLHEHRSEGCTSFALRFAVEENSFDAVRFLHEHRPGNFDALRALQNAEWDHEFVKFLCLHSPNAIQDWFLNQYCGETNHYDKRLAGAAALCVYATKGCLFEAR